MKRVGNILLIMPILAYAMFCGYIGREQTVGLNSHSGLDGELASILDTEWLKPSSAARQSSDLVKEPRTELTRTQILALIDRTASSHKVDPALVRAVVSVESGFNHLARSKDGGAGLMQLMPNTASWLGAKDALDPAQNLQAGTRYLKILLDKFNNKLELAIAAYNAGPSAVQTYNGVPPYPVTQEYVRKVMAVYRASPQTARS